MKHTPPKNREEYYGYFDKETDGWFVKQFQMEKINGNYIPFFKFTGYKWFPKIKEEKK